jgi:hypothetical protein
MSITDLTDGHGSKINKGHFMNLVQIALEDGKIEPTELLLLHREGRKLGLTDHEIDGIIKSEANHHYSPPYSLVEKFDELYSIAKMILADNVISEKERSLIAKFAVAAGFSNKSIDKLIPLLFEGIQKGVDEDDLFLEFRKKHLLDL